MVVNIVNVPERNVSWMRQCESQKAKQAKKQRMLRCLASLTLVFFLMNINVSYATNDTETWVVLGDSISAGYGIPDGKGWVSLFQKKLNASAHSIHIVNESISGDTTAGGLARLPELLVRLTPDVVIIELGGNDGLRGLSLKAMADNLSEMITLCQSRDIRVLLLGMKTLPNYGRKYGALFESVFSTVAKQYQVSLLPFLLEGVGGYQKHMQNDRVHPNSDGQELLVENVWAFVEPVIKARKDVGKI